MGEGISSVADRSGNTGEPNRSEDTGEPNRSEGTLAGNCVEKRGGGDVWEMERQGSGTNF